MSLTGRTALITGGGRGIGRAIATALAALGARVVVTGRTVSELEETAGALGGLALRMDAADRASISTALAELAARVGRVDILINNAGLAESAPLDRTTDAMWDAMMAVNAGAAFALCRALIPPMIDAGWGRVVNLASNAGLTGYAYSAAYCASKHAMVGFTRAIALEIARSNVTINAVCPGWVNTRMADQAVQRIAATTGRGEDQARRSLEAMSPQRRMVEPEEVAHVVAMLCSEAARSLHGQSIPVDGGQILS